MPDTFSRTRIAYSPEINGLRAVAVLAVVLYHAGIGLAGYVGVDVFFVISGYLITRLLHEELQSTGSIDFAGFYARRVRRIFPAMMLIVVVTLGLSAYLVGQDLTQNAKTAAYAAAFMANVFFQTQTGGYWGPNAGTMPLLHLWSLSVEEQFYLLWPCVLLAARRTPVKALAVIAVVSLVLAEWLLFSNPQAAFYWMPPRAWEFALGGLLALHPIRLPKGSALLGLAIVIVACVVPSSHFPGAGAMPAVLGTGMVITSVQSGERVSFLRSRPMMFIGLISYSLYLWHWPLLAMDRAARIGDSPLTTRLVLLAIAFVLAATTYRYVETPFRKLQTRNGWTLAIGVSALAMLSFIALAIGLRPLPAKALPSASEIAADDHPNILRCHYLALEPFDQLPKATCNPVGAKLVIWGDSYALAWQPLAWAIAKHDAVIPTAISRDHCPPASERLKLKSAVESDACAAFNAAVIGYITTHGADTVILAARWASVLPAAERGTRGAINAIAPYVHRILIIGPTPEMPDLVPRCLDAHVNCSVSRPEFESQSAEARTFLAKLSNVEVLDVTSYFCTTALCSGTKDGHALYWDGNHVSSSAARGVAAEYLLQQESNRKL